MSICLPRDEAAPRIARLQAGLTHSWTDLAVQQDATALADCPSLRAWQAGDERESVRLMLCPEHLATLRDFIVVNRRNTEAGVRLTRIHLVDEDRRQRDPGCRSYLDWLREHFRQVNIPWTGETVHWLPLSACARAGITPPRDDMALYDDRVVVTSRYESTQLISRTFHDAEEDHATLDHARRLLTALGGLVAGGTYLLPPAGHESPYPW
jgi:hypothetical protein